MKRDKVVRCTSTSGICAALVESAQSSASRQGNPTAGCQRKSSSSMVRNGFPNVACDNRMQRGELQMTNSEYQRDAIDEKPRKVLHHQRQK